MITMEHSTFTLIMVSIIVVVCALCWMAFHMGKEYAERQQWIADNFEPTEDYMDPKTGFMMTAPVSFRKSRRYHTVDEHTLAPEVRVELLDCPDRWEVRIPQEEVRAFLRESIRNESLVYEFSKER